jgi:hypothetical protein
MDKAEANERFRKAADHYRLGQYSEALAELEILEAQYPRNANVLEAKARSLEHLGRGLEALALFDRLLDDFGFEQARPRRDRLAQSLSVAPSAADEDADYAPEHVAAEVVEVADSEPPGRRFRIKPIRTLLLIAILAGMYFGYLPLWLGIGLIAAYFLIKFALRAAFIRLFLVPFKMKGKALAGATTQVHGFEWTTPPPDAQEEDDEDDGKHKGPLRYVWIDVTITPPERTQGFTHWEPGELALAPSNFKYRSPDDLDKCFQVRQVRFIKDGHEEEDEGYKVIGPHRIKVLAGVPLDQDSFRFAYYFESFGDIRLSR